MKSYVRIHSSFNDDMLLENKSGNMHQWTFRNMVLADGHSRAVSTDKILSSMETIARSHIQKHVVMTSRFTDILRGSGGASPVSDVEQEPTVEPQAAVDYAPPTRDNLRKLARESAVTQPDNKKPNQAAPSLVALSQGASQGPSTAATFGSGSTHPSSANVSGPASAPQPLTQLQLQQQWLQDQVQQQQYIRQQQQIQQQQRSSQNSSMGMAPVQPSSGSNATFSAPNSSSLPKSTQTMDTRASASMSATGVTRSNTSTIPSTSGSGTITANFSSDVKLNDESAFSLYWAIGNPVLFEILAGVSPTRAEKPSAGRLNSFCQNYLQMSQVFINNEKLGTHSDSDKTIAKEGAARKAMHAMQKHPRFARQFLVTIPPDNEGNPTSTLVPRRFL